MQNRQTQPRLGQLACEVAGVPPAIIDELLARQKSQGGRIGEALVARGLLTVDQLYDLLRLQARWVASNLQTSGATTFPLPLCLTVAFPAFNEEENIVDTVRSALAMLPEFVDEFEVVVVNDGSRDRTGPLVAELGAIDSRVRLIEHTANGGYGAAVTTALRAARGEFVMFSDSDGQFSLLDAAQFVAQIEDYDLLIGYRHPRADSRLRLFNAWAWNKLVSTVLNISVRDLDCAFKMFRKSVVDDLQLTAQGACISAEIMAQVFRRKYRLAELPVRHFPRCHGQPTGANWRVIAKAFRELRSLLVYRHPPQPDVARETV